METKTKQINLTDIVAVADSSHGGSITHSQRILAHAQKHGIESLMIFETVQEGALYWLVGQKIEEKKWKVSLIDPKGTFNSSMGERTNDEFIAMLSDVDGHAKATLTVEALNIVPITASNVELKFGHLSKELEKEKSKNDTNRVAIILVSLAIIGLASGLLPIMLAIYLCIGAYYLFRFMYEELIPEIGIVMAILISLVFGFVYIFIWPFGKPWKERYMRKVKAKKDSRTQTS